jgi:hypothetical protein
MKNRSISGQEYRISTTLNDFQREMQIHLVNWKWAHITHEPGLQRGHPNDALLPETISGGYPLLYPAIVPALKSHQEKFPFRLHKYFHHVASSQAANFNLFLPVLLHPQASAVVSALKPDFARLATEYLDHGYQIEFWDEHLADHDHISGTDADIAIAYYNHQDELCLWLIEHKLTEGEFTTCGGFKSPGRQASHDCSQPFAAILANPQLCYYHDKRHFNYWKITTANQAFFPNHAGHAQCPFQGGLNQLWRNQLLGLAIEQDQRQPYQQVTFSVVKHPRNTFLDPSLAKYQDLIIHNPKFSIFTSAEVIAAAFALHNPELNQWVDWYRDLYAL